MSSHTAYQSQPPDPYQKFTIGDVTLDGISDCAWRWNEYKLPDKFNGRSVLDVGAWDGYFAMEAKRRGAGRTMAIDYSVWLPPRNTYERFKANLAKLQLDVEHEIRDVLTLTPQFGQFDIVLFLQVLYHMHDPYTAMRAVGSVCKSELWIETEVLGEDEDRQCFWPQYTGCVTPVMWPSRKAIEGMINWIGFDFSLVADWKDHERAEYPGLRLRRMTWHCKRRSEQ